MQQVADPVQVLFGDRAVQQHLGADLRHHLGIAGLLARHHQRRIARHQLLQAEHQDTDQDQRRNDLRQPVAEAEVAHGGYFDADKPCSRINPSGTARNPLNFSCRPTMLTGW